MNKLIEHCPNLVMVGTDIETTGLNGYFELDKDISLSDGTSFKAGQRVHGALFHSILSAAFVILDSRGQLAKKLHVGLTYNDDMLLKMNENVINMHTMSGLIDRLKTGEGFDVMATTAEELSQIAVAWLNENGARPYNGNYKVEDKQEEGTIFFGNTINYDIEFYNAQCPKLAQHGCYRTINVSSFRDLAKTTYGQKLNLSYLKKKRAHTALEDIMETYQELTIYMNELS